MKSYLIRGTEKTPHIELDPSTGHIEIRGKSIPEDSYKFFEPLNNWLEEYEKEPALQTDMRIALEYFNTSSAKVLLEVFKRLNYLNKSGKSTVSISWVYESDDEDMLEAGRDYEGTVEVPINFVAVESFK